MSKIFIFMALNNNQIKSNHKGDILHAHSRNSYTTFCVSFIQGSNMFALWRSFR